MKIRDELSQLRKKTRSRNAISQVKAFFKASVEIIDHEFGDGSAKMSPDLVATLVKSMSIDKAHPALNPVNSNAEKPTFHPGPLPDSAVTAAQELPPERNSDRSLFVDRFIKHFVTVADDWSVSTTLITKGELHVAYKRFCMTTFAIKIPVLPLRKFNMQIMDYQHIRETYGSHRLLLNGDTVIRVDYRGLLLKNPRTGNKDQSDQTGTGEQVR
ncbi:MAG: hypothetical protein VX768_07820 [Planctomycetota bacterium]|nr:hypothetical protein [Planctomycetota bacterium]